MGRKKDTLTLSVPPGSKARLDALADRLGFYWGTTPSPSALIAAIANAELTVGPPFQLNETQVTALRNASRLLVDAGHIAEAQIVTSLLLDRAELPQPLRNALLQEVGELSQGWRLIVDRHIANQEPFRVLYASAQGDAREYLVRFAEVSFYERRFFLDVWCEGSGEKSGDRSPDPYPELSHNRNLRFDRIQAIVPAPDLTWRDRGLDAIEVQLHFLNALAHAYEPRPQDIHDRWLTSTDHPPIRQVIRRVTHPFWVKREVLRYGKDCLAIAPQPFRQQVIQDLQAIYDRYRHLPASGIPQTEFPSADSPSS
jgi:predicted DNA-binding transcriptional regulator YafY